MCSFGLSFEKIGGSLLCLDMRLHAHHHPVSAEAGELKDSDRHFIRSVTSALMQRMVEAEYGMADYSVIL